MNTQNGPSPDFKAKVVLDALKGEEARSELASWFGVHPTRLQTVLPRSIPKTSDIHLNVPSSTYARDNSRGLVGRSFIPFAHQRAAPGRINANWKPRPQPGINTVKQGRRRVA